MMHLSKYAVIAVLLAGCSNSPTGRDFEDNGFGAWSQQNTLAMTGHPMFAQKLGERFAREVPDTVNFAFNSAQLDAQAQAALRTQAHWIRQFPEARFRVFGHTDLVGSDSYNHTLGLRRAQAVVAFLATQGIDRSRLEALVSYGKTRPLIQTPNQDRQNRRTVTEVSGFVTRHPTVMDGKYAQVVYRDYVRAAIQPHPQNRVITTQIGQSISD